MLEPTGAGPRSMRLARHGNAQTGIVRVLTHRGSDKSPPLTAPVRYTSFIMRLQWRPQDRVNQLLIGIGFPRDWFLIPLAAVVGTLAGVVAVAFHSLVRLSENFFFGRFGEFQEWKLLLLVALPAAGGLAVGLFNHYIAHSEPGHGIPDVIEALARRKGVLPRRTGFYKAITSALTIGSGGSAGQEGPIVQIGSVLGSGVGQLLKVEREHMNTLVGAGAAAGLAGLFNAPIAGVIFVLEVMLRDFSLKTFVPIVVASVLGVATAQALHNMDLPVVNMPSVHVSEVQQTPSSSIKDHAADLPVAPPVHAPAVGAGRHAEEDAIFAVPRALHDYPFQIKEIIPYTLLGLLCGLIGYTFTRSLYWTEGLWHRAHAHPALKPALGGAILGCMGVLFVLSFGIGVAHYESPVFFANGYPVIQWLFDPATYLPVARAVGGAASGGAGGATADVMRVSILFLLVATAAKIIGTSLTLGSGGSGGTFAPSLFMGATFGGAFGIMARALPGFGDITPAHYALVGMAGVLAGAVHCPLTAFLLVFEITNDYKIILPVMLVAVLATTTAQVLNRDSIYTLALRERGIRLGSLSDLTILRRIEVARVPLAPAVTVRPEDPASRLLELAQTSSVSDYVVVSEADLYQGMVVGEDLRFALLEQEALPLMIVAELMREDLATVTPEETLESVLNKFSRFEVSSLAVIDEGNHVTGVITRASLMRQYQLTLEES